MSSGVTFPNVWLRRLAYSTVNRWYGDIEPGIAIGSSSAADVLVGGASTYLYNGLPVAALAGTVEVDLDAFTDLGNSQACKGLLYVDGSDDTEKAAQGPVLTQGVGFGVDAAETDAQVEARCELPGVPADGICLGEVFVITASGETFDFGTDLLTANATNATYRDLSWPDSGPDAFDLTGALDG